MMVNIIKKECRGDWKRNKYYIQIMEVVFVGCYNEVVILKIILGYSIRFIFIGRS